ncbi:MAG: HAMP domain-containing protein, partial [bacterium]|nr:HAMP domain-containing protein [bacterium]
MPKSLWSKLLISYLVLVVLTVSITGVLVTVLIERLFINQRLADLSRRATRVAAGLPTELQGPDTPLPQAGMMRRIIIEEEYWIVNGDGIIVASSSRMSKLIGKAIPKEEWSTLRRGEAIVSTRVHQLLDEPTLLVGMPAVDQGKTVGAIFFHSPLAGITEAVGNVRKIIALAGSIGALAALGFSSWYSGRLTAPLRVMSLATGRLASGDYTQHIDETGINELDSLAGEFNQLTKELQRVISQLEEEKQQAQSILSSMSEGVVVADNQGVLLHLNPVAVAMLGQESTPVMLKEQMTKALLGSHQTPMEVEISLNQRTLLVRSLPLYSFNEVRGAVAVLIDISARRKLEEARKNFVANVSHELKTPLAHIQGYIEAVLDDIPQDENTKTGYMNIA